MNWYENAVMYHIYPLGFCGAPKCNEGGEPVNRLEKVLDWIPHLKELGVDAVYFGPVFESVEHGYDTTDYRVIDRRLGTQTENVLPHICDETAQERHSRDSGRRVQPRGTELLGVQGRAGKGTGFGVLRLVCRSELRRSEPLRRQLLVRGLERLL